MIELVDEPLLTISAPKSKGSFTHPFQVDNVDQGGSFILPELMTSQSPLLSPYTETYALWQELPMSSFKRSRYISWDMSRVSSWPWSPATSQQESVMQGWESPIHGTTCQAKKPIAPHKRVVFSYDAAIALYGIGILSVEHTRAEYRPNCRPNLHRRQRNTRHITRHYHPLHNPTIRRIVRHCKPAPKPEPCQITLYITAKITHHSVRSPCIHPLADAQSV